MPRSSCTSWEFCLERLEVTTMEVDGSNDNSFWTWGKCLKTPAVLWSPVLSYISVNHHQPSPQQNPPPHPRSGSQRLQVPLLRCLLWNLQAFHVATERWGFHGWSTYTFTPLTLPPSEKKRVEIRPKIKGKQWLRKVMGIPGIVIPKKPHQRWSDSTIFLWENSLSLMYFYNMTSDHIFGRETWSLTSGICFLYTYIAYINIYYITPVTSWKDPEVANLKTWNLPSTDRGFFTSKSPTKRVLENFDIPNDWLVWLRIVF